MSQERVQDDDFDNAFYVPSYLRFDPHAPVVRVNPRLRIVVLVRLPWGVPHCVELLPPFARSPYQTRHILSPGLGYTYDGRHAPSPGLYEDLGMACTALAWSRPWTVRTAVVARQQHCGTIREEVRHVGLDVQLHYVFYAHHAAVPEDRLKDAFRDYARSIREWTLLGLVIGFHQTAELVDHRSIRLVVARRRRAKRKSERVRPRLKLTAEPGPVSYHFPLTLPSLA